METADLLRIVLVTQVGGFTLVGLMLRFLHGSLGKRIDDFSLRLQSHEESCEKFREDTVRKLARLDSRPSPTRRAEK